LVKVHRLNNFIQCTLAFAPESAVAPREQLVLQLSIIGMPSASASVLLPHPGCRDGTRALARPVEPPIARSPLVFFIDLRVRMQPADKGWESARSRFTGVSRQRLKNEPSVLALRSRVPVLLSRLSVPGPVEAAPVAPVGMQRAPGRATCRLRMPLFLARGSVQPCLSPRETLGTQNRRVDGLRPRLWLRSAPPLKRRLETVAGIERLH